MKNYTPYNGTETQFSISVARYLTAKGALFTHCANERKTSPMAGAKLKAMGQSKGVPDFLVFNSNRTFNGLAIELKVKYNKPTPEQLQWLSNLEKQGWKTLWSRSLDEVLEVIDGYFEITSLQTPPTV